MLHSPVDSNVGCSGENLLSQSLLESVLRCMSPTDAFSRERVTSQPTHSQAGQEKEGVRLIIDNRGLPDDQYEYIEIMNCKIHVAVKAYGQRSHSSEDKRLRKPDGKAPSQEKLCKDS